MPVDLRSGNYVSSIGSSAGIRYDNGIRRRPILGG